MRTNTRPTRAGTKPALRTPVARYDVGTRQELLALKRELTVSKRRARGKIPRGERP